jgi:serine/threonine-protein kinase
VSQLGENPVANDPITRARFARAQSLFAAIARLPTAEREAALARETGLDEDDLRETVRRLLSNDVADTDFLSSPFVDSAAPVERRLGAYRILERIGRGGSSQVYLAERADGTLRKRVAIKVLDGVVEGDEHRARFERERQILAELEHPNIARFLDGGTSPGGSPYVVLEYVEGRPVTTYCDELRLPIRQRLELFLPICDAVAYAHERLIVHRDLKPANVLVDVEGRPKLLDFGIAKLLDGDPATETITQARALTPAYASPEHLAGRRITVASDVYSLGVVLYELLTGRRPYLSPRGAPGGPLDAVPWRDPQPPSRVVTVQTPDPEATDRATDHDPTERAGLRAASPEALRRALAGDLDRIVLEAIQIDPRERYRSVQELAGDVRRLLSGHPIRARPPSVTYRARKFLRRNWLAVTLAASSLAILISLVVTTGLHSLALERERATAERVTVFLLDVFGSNDPAVSRGDPPSARELLDRGAERLRTELADEPEIRSTLLATLGELYGRLGVYAESERLLQEAIALAERLGARPAALARDLDRLGRVQLLDGQLDAAEPSLRRALHLRETNGASPRELAQTLENLGSLFERRGDYAAAKGFLERAYDLRLGDGGAEHVELANTLDRLAKVADASGDYRAAVDQYDAALRLQRRNLSPAHPDVATTLHDLGMLEMSMGRFDDARAHLSEAVQIRRRVLGAGHPDLAQSLSQLAWAHHGVDRFEEAREIAEEALAIAEAALGPDHAQVGWILANLAHIRDSMGDIEAAQELFLRAVAIQSSSLGPDSHLVADAVDGLATT